MAAAASAAATSTTTTTTATHDGLRKAPFNVSFTIAGFLPPAGQYTLRQVNNNFRESVQRMTLDHHIPFAWCRVSKELHLGCLDFVNSSLRTLPPTSTPPPPQLRIRTGKAYYKAVDEEETVAAASCLFSTYSVAIARCLLFSPMNLVNILVSTDDESLRELFVKCSHFLFEQIAPVLTEKKAELTNLLQNDDDAGFAKAVQETTDHAVAALTADLQKGPRSRMRSIHVFGPERYDKEFPKRLIILHVPLSKSGDVDRPGFGASSFSETLMMRTLLSSVFDIRPHTAENEAGEGGSVVEAGGGLRALTGRDAAQMVGRPHVQALFSPTAKCADFFELAAGCSSIEPAIIEKYREQYSIVVDDAGPVTSPHRESLRQSIFGLNATPKLQQALEDGGRSNKRPFWMPRLNENFLHSMRWNGPEGEPNRYENRVFVFKALSYKTPEREWGDSPVAYLKSIFTKPHKDALLVGETSKGQAVRLGFSKVVEYFEEAQVVYDGLAKQHPMHSSEHFVFSAVATASPQVPRCPLFIADDVSLGLIFNEKLYNSSPLVKQEPWRANLVDDADGALAKAFAAREEELPPRLLTPWILLGDTGSFSDMHSEPEQLHVWVHLHFGKKLWFVQVSSEQLEQGAAIAKKTRAEYEKEVCYDEGWGCFEQNPGETVVMPPGVKHLVVNAAPSMAVARNFVGML